MLIKINERLIVDLKSILTLTVEREKFVCVHLINDHTYSFDCNTNTEALQELDRISQVIEKAYIDTN